MKVPKTHAMQVPVTQPQADVPPAYLAMAAAHMAALGKFNPQPAPIPPVPNAPVS